jgi:hypothetical protein
VQPKSPDFGRVLSKSPNSGEFGYGRVSKTGTTDDTTFIAKKYCRGENEFRAFPLETARCGGERQLIEGESDGTDLAVVGIALLLLALDFRANFGSSRWKTGG